MRVVCLSPFYIAPGVFGQAGFQMLRTGLKNGIMRDGSGICSAKYGLKEGWAMENRDRCPRCGALILPNEKFCSQCGAPLTEAAAASAGSAAGRYAQTATAPNGAGGERTVNNGNNANGSVNPGAGVTAGAAGSSGWRPGMRPRTIEQLQDFCAYNEMPLERMRFFVGEDYRQARAFGIYRDGDRFVVYKNRSDGSRAVRYDGPDEARAVGELYDKLLDECHQRDIWPDGKPVNFEKNRKAEKRRLVAIAVVGALLAGTLGFLFFKWQAKQHANDGYYRFNDTGIYYCYGGDWYYNDGYNDWEPTYNGPYNDYEDRSGYYIGDTYDRGWGYSDFEDSRVWQQIQEESRTSSRDYDGWDSNDTNWDSDW